MANLGEYGADVWCHEVLTDLRTFNWTTWPLGSSEIADFSAVRSWLILDATLIEIRLLGYFAHKKRLIMLRQYPMKKDQWYWDPLEPGYFLGQVEPTKLQEGTYLWNPCKPKSKDLFSLLAYIYLYINIMTSCHGIFNIHFKGLKGLWCRVILNLRSITGKEDLFSSNQMLSKTKSR